MSTFEISRGEISSSTSVPRQRDYDLAGADARRAVETGLASAEWYHTDVPRKEMKALMQRSDRAAIRDTVLWLGAMAVFAAGAVFLWPSLWALPLFLAYGVLYGSASDSRWHECGHGTAFKTRWMNDAVYQIASFMIMRNPVTWRWSHARHHTDTIIVGRDPEIAVMRPPDLARLILNLFGIIDVWHALIDMARNASGRLSAAEKDFIPQMEQAKVIRIARIWGAIYAATAAVAIATGSILPFLLVGGPRLYGAWHHVMTGLLQHGGLAEDVTDHRLNSRTVLMNPVSRFIYWNMNYHVEHHMFPMVPYHALPKLHELIKHDLPAPNPSILDGYREMLPAFLRQLRYDDYFIKRALPPTAKPYREEFHAPANPLSAVD
ncbi:fatty acid desaturase family protein [Nitratireductor sp. ZSWI3]|uniref:fatty acid desaturase family protein n=1 Tax=Nitratireductor sp. ZSWI3 TaxID=2966359 RepID=UPI00214FFF56|nr:fatty acid desaturase family protein [Nitratireductor sp. ZSWI3]MCR4269008.1 fatty acid desaturase family protein [Nitratireductor sp. ZSWI3]